MEIENKNKIKDEIYNIGPRYKVLLLINNY